jgi:hypothetical protein
MTVTFAANAAALLPTRGRSLDHIGFEVKNLDEYVRKLAALGIALEGAPQVIPNTKVRAAYFTDPWGTRIELTENLASIAGAATNRR